MSAHKSPETYLEAQQVRVGRTRTASEHRKDFQYEPNWVSLILESICRRFPVLVQCRDPTHTFFTVELLQLIYCNSGEVLQEPGQVR